MPTPIAADFVGLYLVKVIGVFFSVLMVGV
jgi:hypothetical protein